LSTPSHTIKIAEKNVPKFSTKTSPDMAQCAQHTIEKLSEITNKSTYHATKWPMSMTMS